MHDPTQDSQVEYLEGVLDDKNKRIKQLETLVKEILDWTKYKDTDWAKRAQVALDFPKRTVLCFEGEEYEMESEGE